MVSDAVLEGDRPFGWTQRLICLYGIVWRESLRFLHQRERFISALVRPLVWLFIFAAGFRQTLHRARKKFAEHLLCEVAHTLESPTQGRLEQELADLGLLEYCRPALERQGPGV